MNATLTMNSPIGPLTITSDGDSVTSLLMHRRAPATRSDARPPVAVLAEARAQLEAYFAGALHDFDLPLAARGTPFQQAVWDALRAVPYGTTATYGQIANTVGEPGAARAVGVANARNPIAIVVPCHRIIGASGSLTGYAGGLDRKRFLLELEGALLPV